MTSAQLLVEEQHTPDATVLLLRGAIDMASADALRAAVSRCVAPGDHRAADHQLILDVGDVSFCDSQGLSALIWVNRHMHSRGGRLRLINVGDFMRRLFDITGLTAAFDIDPA